VPLAKICCILPLSQPVDLSGLFAIRGSLIFERCSIACCSASRSSGRGLPLAIAQVSASAA
jgi:hypothetical protein